MEIFRFVARLPQSSEIVFTFSAPESALTASENAGRAALSAMVGSLGEQWRTHFDEGELTGKLREMGFGEIEVLTPEETERRYFHGRSDGLRVSKRSSVASAVVGKR